MQRLRSMAGRHARSAALLVGLGLAVGVVDARAASAAPVDVAAATLVGPSATTALFASSGMVPGSPHVRCLDVTLPRATTPSQVLLRAVGVSGALAPHLEVVVEVGPATGAPEGSCTGFSGTEVYRGTLADLAGLSSAAPYGVDTGWTLTDGRLSEAFRFTVEVADTQAAQGRRATADLVWAVVRAATTPAPTPTPPTTTPPTPTPAPTPIPEPTVGPTAPPATPTPDPTEPTINPTDGPTPRPSWQPTQPPATGQPTTPSAEPSPVPDGRGSILRLLDALPVQVSQTVIGTVRQSGFPAALFGVVGLFLLLQDTVDRRDPKLALAPLDDDDGLPFGPRVDR